MWIDETFFDVENEKNKINLSTLNMVMMRLNVNIHNFLKKMIQYTRSHVLWNLFLIFLVIVLIILSILFDCYFTDLYQSKWDKLSEYFLLVFSSFKIDSLERIGLALNNLDITKIRMFLNNSKYGNHERKLIFVEESLKQKLLDFEIWIDFQKKQMKKWFFRQLQHMTIKKLDSK
jgi:hypothetical protein